MADKPRARDYVNTEEALTELPFNTVTYRQISRPFRPRTPLEQAWIDWRNLQHSTAPASPEPPTDAEAERLEKIRDTRDTPPSRLLRS